MARKYFTDEELKDILMNDSDINDTQMLGDCLESDDNLSDAESEHSDHDTQSEESNSEDETQEESADEIREEEKQKERRDLSVSSNNYFYGKNRYKWSKIPPTRTKRTGGTQYYFRALWTKRKGSCNEAINVQRGLAASNYGGNSRNNFGTY